MTDFLVKKFIKNYEQTDDMKVRGKYGTLSSVTGIVCNILLFILKYIIGILTSSISIISDAFNNLSDSASCIISLIGYKAAAKPADKDHPFGHGRMEYLTSLVISAIIILVGFELFKSSAVKIFHPEKIVFTVGALISLLISIGVKLWMSLFNKTLGTRINSSVMLAVSQDSKNDVIATLAALIGLTSSLITDLPVDALMGVVVSVFILRAGLEIIKDTVDELLGKPADPELVEQIHKFVTEDSRIMGIHDLVVHSYGPGTVIAHCHAEVKSSENIVSVHEYIDACERRIADNLGVSITIHMDPIDTDNPQAVELYDRMKARIKSLDENLKFHDFRITSGEKAVNMIFDIVLPYNYRMTEDEIKTYIDEGFKNEDTNYFTVITFDNEYV